MRVLSMVGIGSLLLIVFLGVVIGVVVGVAVRKPRKKHMPSAPQLTFSATIVAKRKEVKRYAICYVTFLADNGGQKELAVPAYQYDLLAVGDHGTLTMRGVEYEKFVRE